MKIVSCLLILGAISCSKKSKNPFEGLPQKPNEPNVPQEEDLTKPKCDELWVVVNRNVTFEEKLFGDGTANRSVLIGQNLDQVLAQFDKCLPFMERKYNYEQKND